MDIITILMLALVSQHIIQCPALYRYYINSYSWILWIREYRRSILVIPHCLYITYTLD